jgi:molecular chaperone DnaK
MCAQLMSKAVGIDLGTTNSAVAVMTPTDTDIVIHRDPNTRGETTPSCVWKDAQRNTLEVGRRALRRLGSDPPPVRSVKRLMGSAATVRVGGEDTSPEQVSAWILEEMKRQIEEDVAAFNSESRQWIVDRAVVTVPAYFDQPNVDATRRAAELAGLEVVDLLHEPTAAACYHCWRTGTENGLFLVYDFGGGTFDVTVLRSTAGTFEVLGISGNNRLGGDDLDLIIAESIQDRLIRDDWALELDPERDPTDALRRALLLRMAQNVKVGVSQSGEYMLCDAMGLTDTLGSPVIVEALFERPEIEQLIAPTVARTIPHCFDALDQATQRADVRLADVNGIVLAGGSTHMPLVREMVRRNLCALPAGVGSLTEHDVDDPRALQERSPCSDPAYERVDSVVALGAAIRASSMGGLAVLDPARTVRVSFRGVGVTGAAETHLGGSVEALDTSLDLGGGYVRLKIPEFPYEDEQDLSAAGSFAFRRLPLQPSAENELTFEIHDRAGTAIATVERAIAHDGEHARPNGGPGTTAVLSRALLLEVTRHGQLVRREIVPALTTLEASVDHTFSHPGDTELVILALFQDQRKIQEIHVPVASSLPRGTPVELNVHIDTKLLITVRGHVGESEFSAVVQPPEERKPPTAAELAALEQAHSEALFYLPAGRQNVERLKWHRARKAYDDAVRRGDSDQAIHEYEVLEDLVASLSSAGGPLRPPKAEFDGLVAELYELNQKVAGLATERPHETVEVQRTIDAQREAGEQAFAAGEQSQYAESIASLKRIREHLLEVARATKDAGPEPTREERALGAIQFTASAVERTNGLAQACGRPDVEHELREMTSTLRALPARAMSDPDGVTREVQAIRLRIERLDTVLQGSLGSDRGGKPPEETGGTARGPRT